MTFRNPAYLNERTTTLTKTPTTATEAPPPAAAHHAPFSYGFGADALEAVTEGTVFMAAAKPGHDHDRHPMLGDRIVLCCDDKPVGEAVCVLRARVLFTETGVLRALGPFGDAEIRAYPAGEGMAALLQAAEQGASAPIVHGHKLARACGFADYQALWTAQKRLKLDRQHRAVREIVGWRLAQP